VRQYLHHTSALLMMGAGVYLIYYWVFFAGSIFQMQNEATGNVH